MLFVSWKIKFGIKHLNSRDYTAEKCYALKTKLFETLNSKCF